MVGVRRGVCGEVEDRRDFCELRDRFIILIPLLSGEGLDADIDGL